MATNITSTVIAAFRNTTDAQAAARDLETSGISRSDMRLEAQGYKPDATQAHATTEHEGGVVGWFKSIFGSDSADEHSRYESAVQSGTALLSVDVSDAQADNVADIINRHNPVDIHEDEMDRRTLGSDQVTGAGDRAKAGTAGAVSAAGAAIGGAATSAANAAKRAVGDTSATTDLDIASQAAGAPSNYAVPVVEESLKVGTRSVLRGGVRVYSRTVDTPVSESVQLNEEHVGVQRNRVDRPATAADLAADRDKTVEIEEYAEEPVISKDARVVEEVRVGKEQTQRTHEVKESLRHTEVEVESLANQGNRVAGNMDEMPFREHFKTTYGDKGQYEDYGPAYRYGYETAGDKRYAGRSFTDAESDLRADYGRRYPEGTWEKMKDSVRYGWDRMTGSKKA